jgi:hypothetical protein
VEALKPLHSLKALTEAPYKGFLMIGSMLGCAKFQKSCIRENKRMRPVKLDEIIFFSISWQKVPNSQIKIALKIYSDH